MTTRDALELIAPAIPGAGGIWADLGAGEGTFTRALAQLLGPSGRVYAVDRNSRGLAALRRAADRGVATIVPVVADFTRDLVLPGLEGAGLDGLVIANALHYVRDPDPVLARLAARLRPGGRLVMVEYDRRRGNPWVPHPIPAARWPGLAAAAGLASPAIVATRPSAFGGNLYVAVADRELAPGG